MADSRNGEIHWYSPDPRAIIPLNELIITRSLRQTLNKHIFLLKLNIDFEEVIRACAYRKDTWISEEIVQGYLNLHKLGLAHSVETWKDDQLVGGLYGVAIGAAFFGESMFSKVRDASRVALVHLVGRLREKKFELLDTQFITPHLSRLGAIEISREDYMIRLRKAVGKQRSFIESII